MEIEFGKTYRLKGVMGYEFTQIIPLHLQGDQVIYVSNGRNQKEKGMSLEWFLADYEILS